MRFCPKTMKKVFFVTFHSRDVCVKIKKNKRLCLLDNCHRACKITIFVCFVFLLHLLTCKLSMARFMPKNIEFILLLFKKKIIIALLTGRIARMNAQQ